MQPQFETLREGSEELLVERLRRSQARHLFSVSVRRAEGQLWHELQAGVFPFRAFFVSRVQWSEGSAVAKFRHGTLDVELRQSLSPFVTLLLDTHCYVPGLTGLLYVTGIQYASHRLACSLRTSSQSGGAFLASCLVPIASSNWSVGAELLANPALPSVSIGARYLHRNAVDGRMLHFSFDVPIISQQLTFCFARSVHRTLVAGARFTMNPNNYTSGVACGFRWEPTGPVAISGAYDAEQGTVLQAVVKGEHMTATFFANTLFKLKPYITNRIVRFGVHFAINRD